MPDGEYLGFLLPLFEHRGTWNQAGPCGPRPAHGGCLSLHHLSRAAWVCPSGSYRSGPVREKYLLLPFHWRAETENKQCHLPEERRWGVNHSMLNFWSLCIKDFAISPSVYQASLKSYSVAVRQHSMAAYEILGECGNWKASLTSTHWQSLRQDSVVKRLQNSFDKAVVKVAPP